MTAAWFVVVTRGDRDTQEELPPYVVGPYPSEAKAQEACESEEDIIQVLVEDHAREQGYVVDDAYWTDDPPEGERLAPDHFTWVPLGGKPAVIFQLQVNVANDAFHQDQPGELAQCMARVAQQLQDPSRESGTVMDTNGNTVGTWSFEEVR